MEQTEFRSAERAQHSILSRMEKRCLIWFAERIPSWMNSDHLTAVGFLGMVGAGMSYWYARYNRVGLLLCIVCLAVNWFGDSLDGTLARVRNRQRPRYGFYVDHVVDTFSALILLGGLALSGYISPPVAVGMLIAFYMLSIEVYLAAYTMGRFHLSFGGFGPTELRVLLAVGNAWLYTHPGVPRVHAFGGEYRLFDVGGTIAMAGMLVIMIAASARHTRELYRAEPLP